MLRTLNYLKNRVHKLSQRDVIGNQGIIAKLNRKIRALENK